MVSDVDSPEPGKQVPILVIWLKIREEFVQEKAHTLYWESTNY